MSARTFTLAMMAAVCVGSFARGQGKDPVSSDYTLAAREQLFAGTLSGLQEAYRVLNDGMENPTVTGDKRELIFLHALARTGMLVFDRDDIAVRTSLIEVTQPFGVTMTGDKLFPTESDDLDRVRVNLPIDPNDADCLRIPAGADADAAATAIDVDILPQIDGILTELARITDTPAFVMTLTRSETGLSRTVDVDYGDVLSLRATLLAAKAVLYGVANPAHDLTIEWDDPIFAGWQCGVLPAATTINTILNAYPNLLKILPETGEDLLGQAKQNLAAAVDAAAAAMDTIVAETDDQQDDLLQIDPSDPQYIALRSNLAKLQTSLANGTPQAYTYGSRQTLLLTRDQQPLGRIVLEDNLALDDEGNGYIELHSLPGLPTHWEVTSIERFDPWIQIGAEAWTEAGPWWAWLDGALSADGSQIPSLAFQYWAPWPERSDTITGLSAMRVDQRPMTVQINPNVVLAGEVSPRDMLPLIDSGGEPVPGTFGHGLGDDPTLGGVLPGMTQHDWMPGPVVAKTPIYRFWSNTLSSHFYTAGEQEKDNIIRDFSHVWQYEGIGFYALPDGDEPDSLPVYRFWFPSYGAHFYTISETEKEALVQNWSHLCLPEGIAFYAYPDGASPAETVPVHRFWSPATNAHFYTASQAEKDSLVPYYPDWIYEGIAWYAYRP